jgi:hypothetical protein
MQDRELFALALGLTKPWYVSSVEFEPSFPLTISWSALERVTTASPT